MIKVNLVLDKRIVHFGYITQDMKEHFEKCKEKAITNYVIDWAKKDFNFDLQSVEQIPELKERIKEHFRVLYPEIYLTQINSDHQGWARVWMSKHIINEVYLARKNDNK